MKIFNRAQIKEWDDITIRAQQIRSIDLMEVAAKACFDWLVKNERLQKQIHIFCGKGNNGGDGLALACLLIQHHIPVTAYILETGRAGVQNFQENLHRLHKITSSIHFIESSIQNISLSEKDLVIDAIFGTGINKPLEGLYLEVVNFLNKSALEIISIDMPSGLFADKSSKNHAVISATHTLSFQNIKMAFLFAENAQAVGSLHLLDIGLSKNYEHEAESKHELLDVHTIKGMLQPRNQFANKGNFGHAALVAGSHGMMGAALLAARACSYTGSGKLTCHIPACGYVILQCGIPEAMCKVSGEKYVIDIDHLDAYDAIGIGPGLSTEHSTAGVLKEIFNEHPGNLLLDADALNCLSADAALLSALPKGTVITPHPKEFDTLFGETANDFERLHLAVTKAAAHHIYIVLKGHYTAIITPFQKVYFNSTGNAGMAKAGMGDVLTGIITGLMAQHYALPEAALLGVYLHGLAGDIAAAKFSQQAMQASDLIHSMPDAWKVLTATLPALPSRHE